MQWMNEWMDEYDLSDAVTETVAGALYSEWVLAAQNFESILKFLNTTILKIATCEYGKQH